MMSTASAARVRKLLALAASARMIGSPHEAHAAALAAQRIADAAGVDILPLADELGADLDVIRVDPRLGRWELAGAAAVPIVPGRVVTLDGQAVRVGAVEHQLHEVSLRTVVFEERAADPAV
jgi:hypothetical protein